MRISGIGHLSVILSHTKWFRKLKMMDLLQVGFIILVHFGNILQAFLNLFGQLKLMKFQILYGVSI